MADCALSLIDCHFAYEANKPLLQGLCLEAASGARIGIGGDNGCGKSTLLRLLLGLGPWPLPPPCRYEVFQRRLYHKSDLPWLRRQIGFLSQHAEDHLFCPLVIDDVCFGPLHQGLPPEVSHERARTWLQHWGISDLSECPSTHLSGGQSQLAALAAICACQPKILILDEPSSALDARGRELLVQGLQGLDMTLIIASHDQDLLEEVCHQQYRLLHGIIGRT
ncbi:MAG: ATP-binding cassette domain-containing protein [Planctomycetota bacterium]|nr:MAG: ATP-binding cassette domain-containing protein [Planctomycetota bacterium]